MRAVAQMPTESGLPISAACDDFDNHHPGDTRNVKSRGRDRSKRDLVKTAKSDWKGYQET